MIASVHPRACGERDDAGLRGLHPRGSSPRLRGTVVVPASALNAARFIPAPAGNGTSAPDDDPLMAVHPRACGERHSTSSGGDSAGGSSPRLRGTALLFSVSPAVVRFIPAPAGNGVIHLPPPHTRAVHPRACGERSTVHANSMYQPGSSPRLRGTALLPLASAEIWRFIPAPAGNGMHA